MKEWTWKEKRPGVWVRGRFEIRESRSQDTTVYRLNSELLSMPLVYPNLQMAKLVANYIWQGV